MLFTVCRDANLSAVHAYLEIDGSNENVPVE